ncbi:MAG: cation:proton antiporter [Micrococcales bacterium]|nr:cation:proton antiporter [Micrococcales bacterium]MCL2668023.1 cation:proton antiporter [Micrococcales bacterium]
METALPLIIIGVLVTVAVTAFAPKMGVAGPLALVIVGIAVSMTPWWHDLFINGFEVEPDIVLELILPPLLYATAVSMPTMDFRRNLWIISAMAVVLVVVSAVAVGVLLHHMLGIHLALGIAVGAVVSPTDAVATTIVRKAGLSPRVVTVLEGEALLNDATALVLLRSAKGVVAVTAVTTAGAAAGHVDLWGVGRDFLWAVAVAVVIGWVVGRLNLFVRGWFHNPSKSVAISLVTPFIAAVPTEHLNGSGLVAAVVAGLVIGYGSPRALSADERLTEKAVWGTVNLLLEGGIFLLMGLQAAALVDHVDEAHESAWLALEIGMLVALVIMVIRSAFIAPALYSLSRRRRRGGTRERLVALQQLVDDDALRRASEALPGHDRRLKQATFRIARRTADLDYLADQRLGPKEGVVLVWAGMRGAITLAAVQTLPMGVENRALLVLIAFVVAVGTLLVQGSTLPYLVRWLNLDVPTDNGEERRALRADLTAARMSQLDSAELKRPNGQKFDPDMLDQFRAELEQLHEHLLEPTAESRAWRAQFRELRQILIKAQRTELVRQRNLGTYQSELLDEALDQLDADQLGLDMH